MPYSGRYKVEKRNFPRVEASHPVLNFSDTHPSPNVAWTLDLSLGGAGIESSNGLAAGDRFRMHIPIDPETIKCRGKAIYVLGPKNGSMEAGIKFEERGGNLPPVSPRRSRFS